MKVPEQLFPGALKLTSAKTNLVYIIVVQGDPPAENAVGSTPVTRFWTRFSPMDCMSHIYSSLWYHFSLSFSSSLFLSPFKLSPEFEWLIFRPAPKFCGLPTCCRLFIFGWPTGSHGAGAAWLGSRTAAQNARQTYVVSCSVSGGGGQDGSGLDGLTWFALTFSAYPPKQRVFSEHFSVLQISGNEKDLVLCSVNRSGYVV